MKRAVRLLLVLTIAVPATAPSLSAAGQARTYAGRPVADVLREMQTPEFQIIFSSDLVPATLVVKAEPKTAQPRQIAQQILAPHGLALVQGPRGRLLVVAVKGDPRPSTASQVAQPAEEAPAPGQVAADEIRIEERVDVTEKIGETESTSAVYLLEPLKIQDIAGGLDDVLRSLQVLPGVAATNDRDGKMAVRGGGPEHNVVVLDGVQIHNPHRLGEFTSSFLNPATAASVALDASGLEARYGGRLSSVTVIETRDGRRDRRLAFSGSVGLTSGDVLVEGRLPETATGSWWASARGTYYRALDGPLRRRGAGFRRCAVQAQRQADPADATLGVGPPGPRDRARAGPRARRGRHRRWIRVRRRTAAGHRHDRHGQSVHRPQPHRRDEPVVDAGAAARHDDDGVGVRAQRDRLRRIAAHCGGAAVRSTGPRQRLRRAAARGSTSRLAVTCSTRASKRIASPARGAWPT